MYHIVFLAPYSSSIPLIEQVFLARPDCDELFYEIILDRYNNQLEHIHADAVIARGFTARTMKRLNIPGVELSVSGYDVVQAIDRAVKGWPGTRIALIGAQNLLDGAETISSIFSGRDIRAYPILDETRLGRPSAPPWRTEHRPWSADPPPVIWRTSTACPAY